MEMENKCLGCQLLLVIEEDEGGFDEEAFFCRLQSKQSEDTFQWNTQPRRRGSALPWEQKRPETAETQNTNESAQFDGCDGHLSKLV